jgi:two-component system, OmpR family, phosphate regulon response regulator PhoB
MTHSTILVVEDDHDILELIRFTMEGAGFHVFTDPDGGAALEIAKERHPGLILLDLMLPHRDGLELCRELKSDSATKHIPVIMVTARGEEVDRIVGFELGADDYVVKPFSPRELVLRAKAVLRRAVPEVSLEDYTGGEDTSGIIIDQEAHRVYVDNHEAELTATEFKLLAELARNKGRVLTREHLLSVVWGLSYEGYDRTVDAHVRRLRIKLGAFSDRVETVRAVGYRFNSRKDS